MSLAARLTACPGFQWMPGMAILPADALDCDGDPWAIPASRVVYTYIDGAGDLELSVSWRDEDGDHLDSVVPASRATPDMDDPATLGCVLALVREAWGDPSRTFEAEAIVAALEGAPHG